MEESFITTAQEPQNAFTVVLFSWQCMCTLTTQSNYITKWLPAKSTNFPTNEIFPLYYYGITYTLEGIYISDVIFTYTIMI